MDFEKLYGEPLYVPTTDSITIEEIDTVCAQVKEVKRQAGEQFIIEDRKKRTFAANKDGVFVLPQKMDYVVYIKKDAEMPKLVEKARLDTEKAIRDAGTSFTKRDQLREMEKKIQKLWADEKIFEVDAPTDMSKPKFMATFPYPYMNGKLHLGHTFTLSKAEFAVGYQQLKGKNILFPFGFHCTGMPIKSSADKIVREMKEFGNPPQFPPEPPKMNIRIYLHEENRQKKKPKGEAKSKKAKAGAKTGGISRQWKIMESSGVPSNQIEKFADASYWLEYFPPIAMDDLKAVGAKIDWRRTFITTDVNPYYDAFVKWQFERLRKLGKIAFGKRYTIYSPKDNGPCLDHDRASGEGILPSEYTLVKQELLKPYPAALKSLESINKKVYLVPATLRPETMYGQTNCWVSPKGEYGAFEMKDDEIFICTERAARNLAFQEKTPKDGEYKKLLQFTGADIIGAAIKAPLTSYDKIYVLPMFSINMEKTTGVVTSVPSDSPDDYAALKDLSDDKKAALREQYHITPDMIKKVIPIIEIPGLGNVAAEKVYNDLKIKSQNDRELLDQAKEIVYTKGFYEGVLTVGPHKGTKIEAAKPIIKAELIAQKIALQYSEPGGKVISKSGDDCVVCLCDQWYLDYGEDHWRALAEKCLKSMECYSDETRNSFMSAFSWMKQWACSRTYGLGTKLPWAQEYLIDSLSDSTIYMAYYTICHFFQEGSLNGSKPNKWGITPKSVTNGVFDYIFMGKELPKDTDIPESTLQKMRNEFLYWYPLDLRVSGKDLVPNHLLFFIYNHTALFEEKFWPKGVRANGHILVDGLKMAKSTGNFITLSDGINRYGADGVRFALADAGDFAMSDANFTAENADNAILKLWTQIEWTKEMIQMKPDEYRTGPPTLEADHIFLNEIKLVVQITDDAYAKANYKDALKSGFFDLQAKRDAYRSTLHGLGEKVNKDLIDLFIKVQTIIVSPIVPHFSEHIWREVLGNKTSVMKASWPEIGAPDIVRLKQRDYLAANVRAFRLKKEKKKTATEAIVIIAKSYPEWKQTAIKVLKELVKNNKGAFPDRAAIQAAVKGNPILLKEMKKVMPFVVHVQEDFETAGEEAFVLEMPFSELEFLNQNVGYLKEQLGLTSVTLYWSDDAKLPQDKKQLAESATPGRPMIDFK